MEIIAARGYLTFRDCLANIIKNHISAGLAPGSEYLLKAYVTWQNK